MRHFACMAAALAALAFASCDKGERFTVKGEITGAADSVLYFENMSLAGPVTVDSVKLGSDGSFTFSDKAATAPEFYRLRISDRIINISADSTETITVKAGYADMPTGYTVEGSENCTRIKALALKQIDLLHRAMALEANTSLGRGEATDSLMKMVEAYKNDVKENYIFKEPKAASSYFALFQTLGDFLLFNPRNNKDDIKVFAAVATAWDTFYPGAQRGENLHNIAIEGMRNERIAAANREQVIEADKIVTSGVIDIALPDNRGRERTLTALAGKVVLLDFHVFGMKESPARILMLRELYDKFHSRGFEIYQVALDADEHFWKQQTSNLPWICVRDADGLNSRYLGSYNIQNLPEYFIINRANSLVCRSGQVKDVEAEIEALVAAGN
ncbi:MAG: DUF4369 domain-containing protein [Prevotella sp.]|nr:DUF4369 domain-containing protein [Prevotella sp.]